MATLKNTTIDSTESIRLPVGTSAQRPSSPQLGMMRYNTDDEGIEVYDGTDWLPLADAGGGSLYEFTSATFTPGGKTGHDGPSLTQARNGITGGDGFKNNTSYFNVSNGIMQWTVPADGTYRIECWGAQGGDDGAAGRGGRGARMRGDFNLTEGENIRIIVGQKANMGRNGAGGGTYVYRNASDSNPLIVAGGGGGAGGSGSNQTTGGQTGTSGGQSYGGSYASGSGGNGGSTATNSGWGGAGAGWLTNGQDGGSYGGIAYAPRNGARGGNQFVCSGGFAGFGGGGGGGCNGGGGGGGYSGGGCSGGGGGSYNAGSNQSNSGSNKQNDGQVTITLT